MNIALTNHNMLEDGAAFLVTRLTFCHSIALYISTHPIAYLFFFAGGLTSPQQTKSKINTTQITNKMRLTMSMRRREEQADDSGGASQPVEILSKHLAPRPHSSRNP
jgi:hypothetical protein